ncbi:hypothetical protein AK812_SmicGene69 [Symbiodinium microadriaticum]|uniref:Mei2-like C-terminal RNA recognition motif domain-containing protein n=1 Tax=Symbiodinium microadriaticum TaxID=2951 RepID=A0A1Q9F7N0_SYMMI|nr:hypothetical protein AK812_SmicGene69 [Symbiodinium microadriaticum]
MATAMSSRRTKAADDLEEGTTTLMLRRLPLEMTSSCLVVLLNAVAPKEFDFVYLPHDKNKDTNIALAFVNFSEAASARKTFRYFRSLRSTPEWNVGVSAGNVQGLERNLAYFAARFGVRALFSPAAPLLFKDGAQLVEMKDITALYSCLPPSLMQEARWLLKAERCGARRCDGRTRRARRLVWKPGVPFQLPEGETVAAAYDQAAQQRVDPSSGSDNPFFVSRRARLRVCK